MGRPLNRENITVHSEDQVVTVHRTDGTPSVFAGFRTEWMTGEDEDNGITFSMSAGAGVGSPYITIDVHLPDGSTVYEYVDVRQLLTARVEAIAGEHADKA